jgi:aspartyl-tRNA(Asn)/glutamyl-tRNA(Gln) amidotransferase subunit A
MTDLAGLSARALAAAIRSGKVSSLEATKEAIGRLVACHELTNCIVALEAEAALDAARAADTAIAGGHAAGVLAGVPLAHKDMFDRKGKIASWGAAIRADRPAAEDATAIAAFREAGALQIATLHLAEFAYGATGHNYVLGHARNPWDPARITGGSSAGTAAAVSYGAIPLGLGSDTGGSLRLPAACCGIASIKTTWGRVSRAGAMPLAPALDTVGVLARHVEDLAVALACLAGADPRDPAASPVPVPDYVARLGDPVQGIRVGIDEAVVSGAHPQVQRMVEEALAILAKLGLQRTRCAFPDWRTLDHLVQLVQLPDAAAVHAAFLRARPGDYGPQVRARLEVGHFIGAVDHLTALRARGAWLQRTLDETFAEADIVILPTLADPLPTIAELDVGGGPEVQRAMSRVVRFTRPINYLGLPSLTLPVPRSGGLPNGIQLVGRPFAEARLFAVGHAYQREVPPEIARPLPPVRASA